jgi:hypothetical protein
MVRKQAVAKQQQRSGLVLGSSESQAVVKVILLPSIVPSRPLSS